MAQTKLKIGQIGDVVQTGRVEKINYFSDRNLLEFDVLLVKESVLANELALQVHVNQASASEASNAKLTKSKEAMADFFGHGGLLLLFMDYNPFKNAMTPIAGFQMSSENILTLLMLDPKKNLVLQKTGNEFSELNELDDLNRIFNFKYQFLWDKVEGTPIMRPKRGTGSAAFKKNILTGCIYSLPEANRGAVLDSNSSFTEFSEIMNGLIALNQARASSTVKPPAWLEDFLVGDEQQYADVKQHLLEKQMELDKFKEENERSLAEYRQIKQLIFTGDTALEQTVEKVFQDFGFKVIVPDGNKDDLNILEEDFKAVIEVKGLTKSASTANAMQLEKWVSNYGLDHDVVAKGILIVNAFKDIEPNSRKEQAFPSDLLDYSTRRDHCLMLTLDLLHIYLDFMAGLTTKEEIKELLATTVGILNYEARLKPGKKVESS